MQTVQKIAMHQILPMVCSFPTLASDLKLGCDTVIDLPPWFLVAGSFRGFLSVGFPTIIDLIPQIKIQYGDYDNCQTC